MNQYAHQMQQHWINHRPNELATMSDPEAFFTQQGEIADAEIQRRADQLQQQHAQETPSGSSYLARLGQLSNARMTAEAEVMREMLPPDETDSPDPVSDATA